MPKLGRNDPCWCHSGKKYKHCHLDRESQEAVAPWEASAQMRAAFGKKVCSAPPERRSDCRGSVVRAHTIPKSGSLTKIARDGHVYAFIPSLENLREDKGRLKPRLTGINRASTFSGFCALHDDAIFAPLEKLTFSGSPQQCFLLAYRAVSRELYTKQASSSLDDLRKSLDKGRDPDLQMFIQSFAQNFGVGTNAGLRDSIEHKSEYDAILVSGDFSDVRAYVLDIESPPPVMCCGGTCPTHDFTGARLQDLSNLDRTAMGITCTSFWGGECGAVVFSWLKSNDAVCVPFIRSLHSVPDSEVTIALLAYFFATFENVHIDPEWWESRDLLTTDTLIDLMMNAADVETPFTKMREGEEKLKVEPWHILSRRAVGFDLN